MGKLSLVTPASAEPVSVDQARAHARLGPSDGAEAADLLLKLQTARADRESFTQRQFVTATWLLTQCEFEREIDLPRPPLQSVTWVKYYDADNVLQTVDSSKYRVHHPSGDRAGHGEIEFDACYQFPVVYPREDAVQIQFVAGYGDDGESVPAPLRHAILLVFAELYAFREEQTVGSVTKNLRAADDLCWPYRVIS